MTRPILPGQPDRLGATVIANGVNFAVFSAHATCMELCLFSPDGGEERLTLPSCSGDIWHGFVPGLQAGQRYGLRAHGPWAPQDGHLFNPAKLLIDPYARALDQRLVWHPAMNGQRDGGPCQIDSAPFVPKGIVLKDLQALPPADLAVGLIYEAHAKGLTQLHPGVAEAARGRYEGLTDNAILSHLKGLGVTHLELLPVTSYIDDRYVSERRLTNYWGYQPIAFFAPEPRFQGATGTDGLPQAIRTLRAHGVGTILDVVFNHTGEGDAGGPTICYRGLDNKSYYALTHDGYNLNYTGTGNVLNLGHPMVLRLVLDAMRHWAAVGVAGFRFDLATTLLRADGDLMPGSGFQQAVAADPVLSKLVLIAEPWDIGPGGYMLGRFEKPFLEWNDRFRDDVRRFWRGDGRPAELARRIAGSADLFDHGGRKAGTSVNYLTAHDGFTLEDVVSYREKHNFANGESNADGHHDNCSDNMGVEGPTANPLILAARARRKRALLATLFLSQGTPMLLAGDEIGQTQLGNNNAYAQDNDMTWLDWPAMNRDLSRFVARLSALRRAHPELRQGLFLHASRRPDGKRDLGWRRADRHEPLMRDWDSANTWPLCVKIRASADGPDATRPDVLYLVFNAGGDSLITLPRGRWLWRLDSALPDRGENIVTGQVRIPAQSVHLFCQPAPRS